MSVRRRLESHATPETRYQRIGAPTVQAELEALQVKLLPSLCTIERVLAQHGSTSPRFCSAAPANPNGYTALTADDCNQLHALPSGSHDDHATALFQNSLPPRINQVFIGGDATGEPCRQVFHELDIVGSRR